MTLDDGPGWEQVAVTEEHHHYHTHHKQETPTMLVKGSNKEFELCPPGVHVARCYRLIDMGTQHNVFYDNYARKILISWEIPGELMEDGRPFATSRSFTMTLGKKANLRAMLKSWRGRDFTDEQLAGFDISSILGKACMVNVVHDYNEKNETTYANVDSVMPLPKGTECPPATNPIVMLDLHSFDKTVYDALSDNLKERIMQSEEYQIAVGIKPQKIQSQPQTSGPPGENPPPNYDVKEAVGDFDDDVPF